MKRKLLKSVAAIMLTAALCACQSSKPSANVETVPTTKDTPAPATIATEAEPALEQSTGVTLRIASLKGPTTMGMVEMMDRSDKGELLDTYEVSLHGTADEIVTSIVKGEIDIANVPCNLASVLYAKTEGKISVAAINTMGVLYVVESGDAIQSIEDLRGKTVYTTGKGTTPEYSFKYILKQNGIDPDKDLDIQFKSESAEVAAMLETDKSAIAVLPQPYVSVAAAANEELRMALSLTEEWDKVSGGASSLVTGVTIVRNDFLAENSAAFERFLENYAQSVKYVTQNHDEASQLIEQYGIIKAPIAKKALPYCSITLETGEDMHTLVSGYLEVLYSYNAETVGGTLPNEDFYYKG